ncbi:hypothetical protein EJ110_NYTH07350 [Nymphaea thermarum]|nr:hypothetical protein EJ110_NYTH07350 [Nymphaea thermarum]
MSGSKDNSNPGLPAGARRKRLLRERKVGKINRGTDSGMRLWKRLAATVGNSSGGRRGRLLVVANRLPVSATKTGNDSWSLKMNSGGLFEAKSIGWAGVHVPDEIGRKTLTKALAEKGCVPFFLDEDAIKRSYNGYCNNILWPLFHYLGLPQVDRLVTTCSFQFQFDAYKKANQMFADVVYEHYQEGNVLKERNTPRKVGWFLHTPFPSSEIYRTLPSRSEILRSVLAADLLGFHTYDFARHFVHACMRILGLKGTHKFPIGIDPESYELGSLVTGSYVMH